MFCAGYYAVMQHAIHMLRPCTGGGGGGGNLRSYSQEEAQAEKGNILYILKGNKECLCPWGHVGLEHNDSQCGPPETNCH